MVRETKRKHVLQKAMRKKLASNYSPSLPNIENTEKWSTNEMGVRIVMMVKLKNNKNTGYDGMSNEFSKLSKSCEGYCHL